jgi:hypothetical protein
MCRGFPTAEAHTEATFAIQAPVSHVPLSGHDRGRGWNGFLRVDRVLVVEAIESVDRVAHRHGAMMPRPSQ